MISPIGLRWIGSWGSFSSDDDQNEWYLAGLLYNIFVSKINLQLKQYSILELTFVWWKDCSGRDCRWPRATKSLWRWPVGLIDVHGRPFVVAFALIPTIAGCLDGQNPYIPGEMLRETNPSIMLTIIRLNAEQLCILVGILVVDLNSDSRQWRHTDLYRIITLMITTKKENDIYRSETWAVSGRESTRIGLFLNQP